MSLYEFLAKYELSLKIIYSPSKLFHWSVEFNNDKNKTISYDMNGLLTMSKVVSSKSLDEATDIFIRIIAGNKFYIRTQCETQPWFLNTEEIQVPKDLRL